MNAAFISFTKKVRKDTKVSGMREGVTEVPSVIPAEAGIQVRWGCGTVVSVKLPGVTKARMDTGVRRYDGQRV
jgi:hypothetical protein